MVAASGAKLLQDDAVSVLVERLFPLATVVTPNLHEACVLAGVPYSEEANREELAEAIHGLGTRAVVVTGGHGTEAVDWLFDGERHVPIAVERYGEQATHGAGCTHSAALTAFLAQGETLEEAARGAARVASEAVRSGLQEIGSGSGPVDVFGLRTPFRMKPESPDHAERHDAASSVAPVSEVDTGAPCVLASHPPARPGNEAPS
jgi:hydroxymethylpyrimidine/phosphomethylpyrimidine kinase